MNIHAIIMAYRADPSRAITDWLEAGGVSWEVGSQIDGIACARNQNCNHFMVETSANYLLMIDGDMIPLADSLPILTEPGDVLYCGYCGWTGTPGHYGAGAFGAGFMRVSRYALSQIPKPLFNTPLNAEGVKKLSCECNYFAKRAREAGFVPRMVGVAGHLTQMVAIPRIVDGELVTIYRPKESL